MSILDGRAGDSPGAPQYAALGYLRNPFPKQGQVEGDVYVKRPELAGVEQDLEAFLGGRDSGSVWAIQGSVGVGKSNFLRHIESAVRRTTSSGELEHTAFRFVTGLDLTPQRVAAELVLAIGEEPIDKLVLSRPLPPSEIIGTDFGRFWLRLKQSPMGFPVDRKDPAEATLFLMQWLGGQTTSKGTRDKYGVTGRDRLPPAVAFSYIRTLVSMLDTAALIKRIVLMLDEFEDVEQLARAEQTQYVHVLKTLLNTFNWKGLYVLIAGQPGAFVTIGEKYPSLASRWKPVSLSALRTTEEAVELASAYKSAARLSADAKPSTLAPTDIDIKSEFITLFERSSEQGSVTHRVLLTRLHEWVEAKVSRSGPVASSKPRRKQ